MPGVSNLPKVGNPFYIQTYKLNDYPMPSPGKYQADFIENNIYHVYNQTTTKQNYS
jgi:hypothetical protein